ncbi:MAG: hypothetical protein ACD_39C01768G0001, partial [uncultured bacterium]
MIEAILAMSLIEKVFLTCALCGTVVFTIRMILMFSGMISADTDGDIGHDAPDAAGEVADDVHDDISHDIATDSDTDHSGEMTDSSDHDHQASSSDISFHYISVQGLTAFFMMFGWVGLALVRDSMMPGWIATIGGTAAGFLMVWVLAQ